MPDNGIEKIEVQPSRYMSCARVTIDESIEIICDNSSLDNADRLKLYCGSDLVARIELEKCPLEIPRMIKRAVLYKEKSVWC